MQSETSETPGPPLMFLRASTEGEAADLFTTSLTQFDLERRKGVAGGSTRSVTTQEENRWRPNRRMQLVEKERKC